MKKIINQINITIQDFSTWGIYWLFSLIIIFYTEPFAVIQQAYLMNCFLSYFCIYLLASLIVFPISFFHHLYQEKKHGYSTLDAISLFFMKVPEIPYAGFEIINFHRFKKVGMTWRAFMIDLPIYLGNLFRTIAWWIITSKAVIQILSMSNYFTTPSYIHLNLSIILFRIGICLLIYIVLFVIVKVLEHRFFKHAKEELKLMIAQEEYRKQSRRQPYKGKLPACCKACGGPYPDCRISCSIFDD